jgi:hypothetical protein
MITRCSLLACALALCCTPLPGVAAEDDPDVPMYSVGLDEHTELVWTIKRSRLMAIPPWRQGAEEAPLSPHKAVTAASEYVQSLGAHAATVVRIWMTRVGEDRDNRWIYDVHFNADPLLEWDDPRLRVAVAMDGKVIVPMKRQRGKTK